MKCIGCKSNKVVNWIEKEKKDRGANETEFRWMEVSIMFGNKEPETREYDMFECEDCGLTMVYRREK